MNMYFFHQQSGTLRWGAASQSKMVRRVRRKAPARCGLGEKSEMISSETHLSAFGGFPLAAVRAGIKPLWASEIEAFPIEVTKHHFPRMTHMGDITMLDGARLPPVDIICGGSPCQDCLWPERALV